MQLNTVVHNRCGQKEIVGEKCYPLRFYVHMLCGSSGMAIQIVVNKYIYNTILDSVTNYNFAVLLWDDDIR